MNAAELENWFNANISDLKPYKIFGSQYVHDPILMFEAELGILKTVKETNLQYKNAFDRLNEFVRVFELDKLSNKF